MLDIFIGLLKFLGIILAGVFGIYGLLVKFKNDAGAVTKQGRIALILIIVSTVIAIGSHGLELVRQKEKQQSDSEQKANEMLEAVQRTEKMLSAINRGLHPIKDVRFSYWIRVPTDHVQFKGYLDRFQIEAAKIIPRLNNEEDVVGIVGGRSDQGRNCEAFDFDSSSPLAPDEDIEKLAYLILQYGEVELQFYKEPIQVDDHPRISNKWDKKPDLKLSAGSQLTARLRDDDEHHHAIEYEIKPKQFAITAHAIPSNPRFWESNGEVVGIPDLLGTQLFILLPSVVRSGDPQVDQYIPEIRTRFELKSFVVDMSNGREFWISEREGLKRHSDKDGYPIYVFQFPKTMEELSALSR